MRVFTVSSQPPIDHLWDRYSSLPKALWVLAWCRHFDHNTRLKLGKRDFSERLSAKEIDNTLTRLLCLSQQHNFEGVRNALHRGKAILSPPHWAALRPFLDSEGLLRVGGRLSNADVDSNLKHPIILHGRSPFVRQLVEITHKSSLHTGPTTLLALLERYHVIGVRWLAKSISKQCVICQCIYLKTAEQLMSQLP